MIPVHVGPRPHNSAQIGMSPEYVQSAAVSQQPPPVGQACWPAGHV